MEKIGLGGSCHWCTEAIFNAVVGVSKVEQGWISAHSAADALTLTSFSEAIVVTFSPQKIELADLIAIHLHSHSCTSNHLLREKYRSAIYVFTETQKEQSIHAINRLQADFDKAIITQVLSFNAFKGNQEKYLQYYQKNSENSFCQNFINPKLTRLREKFKGSIKK